MSSAADPLILHVSLGNKRVPVEHSALLNAVKSAVFTGSKEHCEAACKGLPAYADLLQTIRKLGILNKISKQVAINHSMGAICMPVFVHMLPYKNPCIEDKLRYIHGLFARVGASEMKLLALDGPLADMWKIYHMTSQNVPYDDILAEMNSGSREKITKGTIQAYSSKRE